jgi:hypothetical protein
MCGSIAVLSTLLLTIHDDEDPSLKGFSPVGDGVAVQEKSKRVRRTCFLSFFSQGGKASRLLGLDGW